MEKIQLLWLKCDYVPIMGTRVKVTALVGVCEKTLFCSKSPPPLPQWSLARSVVQIALSRSSRCGCVTGVPRIGRRTVDEDGNMILF